MPAACCPALKLNVFAIVLPVSPDAPDPTLTFVLASPSPKFQVYMFEVKTDCGPGLPVVLLVNVTGKPDVLSSFTPLTTPPAAEYATECVE